MPLLILVPFKQDLILPSFLKVQERESHRAHSAPELLLMTVVLGLGALSSQAIWVASSEKATNRTAK